MNISALVASERSEKINHLRQSGFTPGVLYGAGFRQGTPVKFDDSQLNKLTRFVHNDAKIWVEFNGKRLFGMIKELQKEVISGRILHIDIHLLAQGDTIRIALPILFAGEGELEHKNLKLKIKNNKIEVSGEAGLLPEHVTLNLANFNAGDIIQQKDLGLNSSIIVHDPVDEIYALVMDRRNTEEEAE